MGWSHAKCKCGDVLTRYESGWKHHADNSLQCPDGKDADPQEEMIEVIRFVTWDEYEQKYKEDN